VFTSRQPTHKWTSVKVASGGDAGHYTISCPSPTLCAFTTGTPNVFASENPARLGAWVSQTVDSASQSAQLTVISCPTTTTCIALDNAGNATIGHVAPPPTPAQIRAALRRHVSQIADRARIRSILRHRAYSTKFTAPAAGTLTEKWYRRRGKRKPALLAVGVFQFASGGPATISIKLPPSGRNLLPTARRSIWIAVQADFAPYVEPGVKLRKPIAIRK
jgi:hypothetical protein